jgi:hypothetical protein
MFSQAARTCREEADMSVRKIKGSQWWLAMVAFLAGMAVYAGASSPRPQAPMAAPTTSVVTPAAEIGGYIANASSDTCDVQLD